MWPINASLIFLLAATGLSGSAKSQGETPVLLRDWQSLPDLFELARLKMKDGDVYREQARLEKEYRAKHLPFRTTTNFRHQVSCSTKEHWAGAADFHLVNSNGETVTITRKDLHEVEQHGADFPPKVAAFLRGSPLPFLMPTSRWWHFRGPLRWRRTFTGPMTRPRPMTLDGRFPRL